MDQPRKIMFFHQQTGEYIGTLNNRGEYRFWDDVHEQDMDGTNFFNFMMPNTIDFAEKVVGRVRVMIPHEETGWQEFIIHSVEDDGEEREVRTNGAETDLNKLKIVEPGDAQSLTAYQYVELCTENTIFEPGIIEFSGSRTIDRSRPRGAYDYLGMVCTEFDLEMRVRTETKGGRITKRYVDLLERIGSDRAQTVEHGKDLVAFRKLVDSNGIVTSLYCQTPEREDGTRIYATVTHAEAFQQWNWQGTHLTGIYEPESDNQDMTVEQLRQYGQTALNKLVAAVFEYDVEAISLEYLFPHKRVRIGDRINVKNTDIKPAIYARARILRVIRSISNETSKRYIIGEIKEELEADVLKTFRELQSQYALRIVKQPEAPPVQKRMIWVKTNPTVEGFSALSVDGESEFEVSHIANAELTAWIPQTATTAEQINGVELEKEYNQVSISKNTGLKVTGVEDEPVGAIDGTNGEYYFPKVETAELVAPNVLRYADYTEEPLTIRVASESSAGIGEPDDANDGGAWSRPMRTISAALGKIAPMFRGTARISVAYGQTFNEEIDITGFAGGGTLIIEKSADTTRPKVTGHVIIENNTNRIEWRDINLDSTDVYAGFFIRNSHGIISDCHINGAAGNTEWGINTNALTGFELLNIRYSNCVSAVRASYGGKAYAADHTGEVSGVVFVAFGGGKISGGGTAPTGSALESEIRGGVVDGTWTVPAPPTPPAPVTQQTKQTWSANSDSGTWRADEGRYDIYGASVNNVTQGAYAGYGPFTGAWFFGSSPSTAVTGKQIKSIRLYCGRVSGGSGSGVGVKFKPHTSASRPSGRVTLQTPEHTASFKVGEEKWITLPSSFHSGFEAGTTKGIAIYSGSSAYAKMKKTAKLEIIYEG